MDLSSTPFLGESEISSNGNRNELPGWSERRQVVGRTTFAKERGSVYSFLPWAGKRLPGYSR